MTRTPRSNDLRAIARKLRRLLACLSRKTAGYAGAGLALAAVAGGAAAGGLSATAASAAPMHHVSRTAPAASRPAPAVSRTVVRRAAPHGASPAAHAAPARPAADGKVVPATPASRATAAAQKAPTAPAKTAAPAKTTTLAKTAAPAAHAAPAKHATATVHATPTERAAPAASAKKSLPVKHAAPARPRDESWVAIRKIVASHTYPKAGHGALPAQDQLRPVGPNGPQSWMPITPARYQNAKTIVRQAIDKHMGLRSAVIAVATSMQESTLLNLKYGTSDSLGLFQQRPSCGWGTPAQIERPTYAADAFLKALRGYQAGNPAWAHQPLWQAAQGVQASAFPTAYAKWEAQATNLVASVTKHLI